MDDTLLPLMLHMGLYNIPAPGDCVLARRDVLKAGPILSNDKRK